ncbi:agmatinase [Halonotius terrestris]|uniref:Agmatinase n=1 Tax=Halonotius terrestris TaxID=2487750 RepID=A0A8J8TCE1_9EURY|nr:agmatinase [Halonotius terrestris]TQQ83117.1 agmatinase [Halonotius terrestris]
MFPGATADREAASYVVVGAPLDATTTFQPGTRFGPDEIRRFARSYDDYDHQTAQHFTELGVHDAGDVRAWEDVEEYADYLGGQLRDIVWDDAVPIVLGGEHTVTAPAVEAVDPDVFVCLDAHLDLRTEYDGNEWSHACVTNRALDTVDEAIILGARTGSEAEWDRASEADVTVVEPDAVDDWLADPPAFGDDSVYLSVDIDAADPGFAPGTGTMEPGGLTPRQLQSAVQTVAPACDGFDIVEVNDRDDGQAAALAGKLLRRFVFDHAAES